MPNLIIDRVGERFGRWTVLALHPERSRFGKARWVCRCDCGSEGIVVAKIAQRLVEKLRLHSKRSMCKTQHHARPVSHSRL